MKKIVSFGDSFVFGTELTDNLDGSKAWPALVAKNLGTNYETRAIVACGNESIARQIYTYFSDYTTTNTLAIINWTWSMRWDFYLHEVDAWVTLGPTCVPGRLQQHIPESEAENLIKFYQTYTGASPNWNLHRSLQAIWGVLNYLKVNNIMAIHTYMDPALFNKGNTGDRLEHYCAIRDPGWPNIESATDIFNLPTSIQQEVEDDYNRVKIPLYLSNLQDLIQPAMQSFDGQSFLEWSRSCGHAVTPAPAEHPLQDAHNAAADYWQDVYNKHIQLL